MYTFNNIKEILDGVVLFEAHLADLAKGLCDDLDVDLEVILTRHAIDN
jgi:hypothetical protein